MAEILVVDDLDRTLELCRKAMPQHRFHGPLRSWAGLRAWLSAPKTSPDLVLLDVHFDIPSEHLLGLTGEPGPEDLERARRRQGLEILARMRRSYPNLPVILMTSRDDLPLEEEARALDAQEYTYFLDDDYVDAHALAAQVHGVLQAGRGAETDGPVFWGRSLGMRRIRQRLLVLSRGRLPIILAGPTGSGKSLLVKHFIHERSRRKGALVTMDLATLPRDLMAAHLFGSMRGAYTGSVADRKGAFEAADHGTLFLDEVGNLPEEAQRMLLTVLQDGRVTRLGDTRERLVDVKLVVASNENLARLVSEGRFRADLFMRLNPACTVELPPLRERMDDFEALLHFCVERALESSYPAELLADYLQQAGLQGSVPRTLAGEKVPPREPGSTWVFFSRQVVRQLRAHSWPGNLREFSMTVENALTFTLAELAAVAPGRRPDVIQVRPKLVHELLTAVGGGSPGPGGWTVSVRIRPFDSLNQLSQSVERQYFLELFKRERGDFSAMARVLLGDAALARKVQLRFNQLGLKVRELRRSLVP